MNHVESNSSSSSSSSSSRRRASVAHTSEEMLETHKKTNHFQNINSQLEPIQLIPASQLPRRHSTSVSNFNAVQTSSSILSNPIPTAPTSNIIQVSSKQALNNSIAPVPPSPRTPPAVPARGRKSSTDKDDTPPPTHTSLHHQQHSTTTTTTTTTTTSRPTLVAPSAPAPPAPAPPTLNLQTNPFLYSSNNPFLEHLIPPAIPPPPTRPRRASSAFYDGSNPASRRSSSVSTAGDRSPTPQPTIILPTNFNKKSPIAGVEIVERVEEKQSEHASRSSVRQDSNVSSDSMSQTSSPSYTTKTMETPLLLHHAKKLSHKTQLADLLTAPEDNTTGNGALTKSISTPASLQTCVKFTTGSNMTLQHRVIHDVRRPSENYSRGGCLKYRCVQVIVNVIAIFALAMGMMMYFESHTTSVPFINNTMTTTVAVVSQETNPSPGFCVRLIVKFCENRVPYNFTTFPNHVVNMNQAQAEQVCRTLIRCVVLTDVEDQIDVFIVIVEFCLLHRVPYNYTRFPSRLHVNQYGPEPDLELYDAVVDVRCYELSALFLCSVFVPKCGPMGQILYPCKSLCEETKRRCGFFLEVFGLKNLPDYLMECNLLPDSDDADECVGYREVKEAKIRSQKPNCSKDGFLCDYKRCIPLDWKCDGHLDCEDQTDEQDCNDCSVGMVHCGEKQCMNIRHRCNGEVECPYGQDERNCIRLQERMGDIGSGMLQVYKPESDEWVAACFESWDKNRSAQAICEILGYTKVNVNYTTNYLLNSNVPVPAAHTYNWTDDDGKKRIFQSCERRHYPTVKLECLDFACGRGRNKQPPKATKRIVGGFASRPGDWPFLAALLGGPEEIFYCAGVLIADQWVLTASHCAGNYTESTLDGWKIQLGITRRHSHNYYGQKVKVKRVITHPLYNVGVNHDNDIALFQLKERINFNEYLLPVCLPPPGKELLPGTNCTVIGWGKSEDAANSEYEPVINEVEVPVINRELCNKWMIYKDLNVTEGMICAGLAEGGKDACQGDSGGPLLCPFDRRKDRWFVGGIVSWGIKCANPHLPGVYAYVPKYVPWIREQMELYAD